MRDWATGYCSGGNQNDAETETSSRAREHNQPN